MTERNTENLDAKKPNANSVRERIAANERARDALREKIDKIVDGQDDPVVYPVDLPEEGADEKLVTGPVIATAPKPRREKTQVQNIFAKMLKAKGKLTERKTKRAARPKKEMSEEKKRKILIFGGAGLAVVAVAVVVVVVAAVINNRNEGCNPEDALQVSEEMEWYGNDPSVSAVVAVFSSEIENKLRNDGDYTYEDAAKEFEDAYVEGSDELKIELSYRYGYFIYNNTNDLSAALDAVMRVERLLNDERLIGYYSVISNLYDMAGEDVLSMQYRQLAQEYGSEYSAPLDDEYLSEITEAQSDENEEE